MRVGTLLLANAFLLAAMATAYRASRPSSRTTDRPRRPDPTATRRGRRLLAAALVCFAAHVVVLGVDGV